MMDRRKIEKAAEKYAEEAYIYEEEIFARIASFQAGVKWAEQEFVKSLWHHVSEPPKNHTDIAYIDIYGDMYCEKNFYTGDLKNIYRKDWITFAELCVITNWCYLDDIRPKKGANILIEELKKTNE